MKVGTVALFGRPNTGKSTLINNLIGRKVTITSPKPQTTQIPIYAIYEDEESQIIFVDTPGIFAKTKDERSKEGNLEAEEVLKNDVDAVVYLVDHTRKRGVEENRVIGTLRKLSVPKILVINKMDIKKPSYIEQYKFLEDEFDEVIEVSALKEMNLKAVIDTIKKYLSEGEKFVNTEEMAIPVMNFDSKMYIEEVIREKAFLRLRREVPYHITVYVDEITEREGKDLTYIKARIITIPRYQKMIIGQGGSKIKEISSMSRKELEVATGRKIYLDLTVESV